MRQLCHSPTNTSGGCVFFLHYHYFSTHSLRSSVLNSHILTPSYSHIQGLTSEMKLKKKNHLQNLCLSALDNGGLFCSLVSVTGSTDGMP